MTFFLKYDKISKEGSFMKKFLWIFPLLLITCACSTSSEPLVCTIKEETEEIDTEIQITTEFEKGKATLAKANAIMYFEDEEEAKAYYDAYTEEKTNVKLEENRIIIVLENSFKENGKDRKETKKYFEEEGYTCK